MYIDRRIDGRCHYNTMCVYVCAYIVSEVGDGGLIETAAAAAAVAKDCHNQTYYNNTIIQKRICVTHYGGLTRRVRVYM